MTASRPVRATVALTDIWHLLPPVKRTRILAALEEERPLPRTAPPVVPSCAVTDPPQVIAVRQALLYRMPGVGGRPGE